MWHARFMAHCIDRSGFWRYFCAERLPANGNGVKPAFPPLSSKPLT
jgi:hypothetical protein